MIGILLAGGMGTRLKTVVADCPKPFIPCEGKPFIDWILRYFHRFGIDHYVISLGHLADVAQDYLRQRPIDGITIETAVEDTPLGTAGAVRFAWDAHQQQSALVMNGDSLLFADFTPVLKLWNESQFDALVVGVPQKDASRYGTLTFSADGRLQAFQEKRPGEGIINAGIYLFRPSLLQTIPTGQPLSLEKDLFPQWLEAGRDIRVCIAPGEFLDIGLPESLAAADDFLRRNWPKELKS